MCTKTGDYVVWTGDRKNNYVAFCCEKHLGGVVHEALLKHRRGPVKVSMASCDDAPCEGAGKGSR